MQKIQIQTAQWISKLRKKAGKAMLVRRPWKVRLDSKNDGVLINEDISSESDEEEENSSHKATTKKVKKNIQCILDLINSLQCYH